MLQADTSNPTTWIKLEFWRDIIHQTLEWAVVSIPKVLVVLLLAVLLLKVVSVSASRIAERAVSQGATDSAADAVEHKKRVETLLGIVLRVAKVSVSGLAIVLVLMQIGVDVAPVIAGAGVLGIAIGFGAQELVRDVVTGFFQLLENHVRKGDVAVINGTGGVVESIGLRTIVLRDLSGVVHVFQNGKIETMANMTKTWSAMVFDIGVAYREDIDQALDLMRQIGEELRQDPQYAGKIIEPFEILGVESIADNAVVLRGRIKTLPIEQWTVGREYRRRLKKLFDKHGIQIPFNRTMYWNGAGEPFGISRLTGDKSPQ